MNENTATVSQDFALWISDTKKCISFHPAPGYEMRPYMNHKEMMRMVQELIEHNYRVQ